METISASDFARQRYLARVGLLHLFTELQVHAYSLGDVVGLGLAAPDPLDPARKIGDAAGDAIKASLASLDVPAGIAGEAWRTVQGNAVDTLNWVQRKTSGPRDGDRLYRVVVHAVASAWDAIVGLFRHTLGALSAAGGKIVSILKQKKYDILERVLTDLARQAAGPLKPVVGPLKEIAAAADLFIKDMSRTVDSVRKGFGANAFASGHVRHINEGLYLARGLNALAAALQLGGSGMAIAASTCGWPGWASAVAGVMQKAIKLTLRHIELWRLRALVDSARGYAQEHGYLAQGRFVAPAHPAQGGDPDGFDAFYEENVRWFPAASALALLVPDGLSWAWIYLNVTGDPRYWVAASRTEMKVDVGRVAQGVEEIERFRSDARRYLKLVGLAFAHPHYNMDRCLQAHYGDALNAFKRAGVGRLFHAGGRAVDAAAQALPDLASYSSNTYIAALH